MIMMMIGLESLSSLGSHYHPSFLFSLFALTSASLPLSPTLPVLVVAFFILFFFLSFFISYSFSPFLLFVFSPRLSLLLFSFSFLLLLLLPILLLVTPRTHTHTLSPVPGEYSFTSCHTTTSHTPSFFSSFPLTTLTLPFAHFS